MFEITLQNAVKYLQSADGDTISRATKDLYQPTTLSWNGRFSLDTASLPQLKKITKVTATFRYQLNHTTIRGDHMILSFWLRYAGEEIGSGSLTDTEGNENFYTKTWDISSTAADKINTIQLNNSYFLTHSFDFSFQMQCVKPDHSPAIIPGVAWVPSLFQGQIDEIYFTIEYEDLSDLSLGVKKSDAWKPAKVCYQKRNDSWVMITETETKQIIQENSNRCYQGN